MLMELYFSESYVSIMGKHKSIGHFETKYDNTEGLLLKFLQQLEKLYDAGLL
jgi:hypothetical protein